MNQVNDAIDLNDALHAMAIMGDLSMGQPMDHSLLVASWSAQLAQQLGLDAAVVSQVQHIALLRWSGCTANASEVAATITDDVSGRAAMLALQFEKIEFLVRPEAIARQLVRTASIHCEVSGLIAKSLGLDATVSRALDCVFEHWDGSGSPRGLRGDAIPVAALVVSVCSELELLARAHGLPAALQLLRQRADVVYPAHMVDCVADCALHWLSELPHTLEGGKVADAPHAHPQVQMAVLGHAIDLKLPWLTGHSQAVVLLADAIAASMGLAPGKRATLRRAGWLHGLGRVAIPNRVWSRASTLTAGDWEQIRLAPYWISRAAKHIAGLADAAGLASQVYERLDGSGYFRGTVALGAPLESRILAACVAWVAMRADRPWRNALSASSALEMLRTEGQGAAFDAQVLAALAGCVLPQSARPDIRAMPVPVLSGRERDVLRRISLGDSNKAAAQRLGISPSTVRTHLESAFKKLDCKTRAACTLRASLLGLLA